MSDEIIVGLDIGTQNIRAAIAECIDDKIEIIGVAKRPSSGLRNGVIVNIDAAMNSIKETIDECEQKAGMQVYSCVTAIGGKQIESLNSQGSVKVSGHGTAGREIDSNDIARVREAASAVPIPMDREMLHTIPQRYSVDGVDNIKDPLKMIGVRLEAKVHVVTASRTQIENVRQCVGRAGYGLDRIMLKTLAATQAVVRNDELEMGSIVIDLGEGTTDVLVLINSAPVTSISIPFGGRNVTSDISQVKGIPLPIAQEIKEKYGCCWYESLEEIQEVVIPGVGGRESEITTQAEICDIIQPRLEEILLMIRKEIIRKTDLTRLSGNIILIGGGAQMAGIVELTKAIFRTNAVHLGIPENLGGVEEEYRQPEWATVIGLIEVQKNNSQTKGKTRVKKLSSGEPKTGFLTRIWDSLWH
ncbi:MAG: cell division protein FtsA [Treponema sp.]|nr:cell division protein FtsA [Treponema sp.]